MTTTFETAKVGDRVWSSVSGWGTITYIDDSACLISVYYNNGEYDAYTVDGVLFKDGGLQVLFWDEVVIEAPKKPAPDLAVDTKVLVWNDPNKKNKRHFSHFSNGRIYAFDNGNTSFTRLHAASVTGWPHWELAE